jgi:BirA family biotin operon repressor/biotin-[acetyl-CoA-carboxylase] ligase
MATALGVATALEALGIDVQTKWPNDLLVCQRKICGILAERCAREAVVVGVGLNVNMRADEAAEIDQPATSIAIEKGETYDVREALGFLLPHIEPWIARWRARGFAGLQEAWTQRCAYVGASVRVRDGRQERTGILQGFGPAGQLLLREEDGRQREVWVGDLSAEASENT